MTTGLNLCAAYSNFTCCFPRFAFAFVILAQVFIFIRIFRVVLVSESMCVARMINTMNALTIQ